LPATAPTSIERVPLRAATELGFAYSTLRKKIASGDLPAERFGRRLFVRVDDLEALLTPVVGRPTDDSIVETAIDRVVASAPRLTIAQRERLAVVLGGGAA
jgi:excisionase family DNA binding protein